MKFLKENVKVIVAFVLGLLLAGGVVFASGQYLANQVDYKNNKTVEDALDDLYGKIPSGTIPITTKGNQIDVGNYKYADTTGLYTLDEVQSGKGVYWNEGTVSGTSDGVVIDTGLNNVSKLWISATNGNGNYWISQFTPTSSNTATYFDFIKDPIGFNVVELQYVNNPVWDNGVLSFFHDCSGWTYNWVAYQ